METIKETNYATNKSSAHLIQKTSQISFIVCLRP